MLDGSGIDLDVSREVEVETSQLEAEDVPGPPCASSTPAKNDPKMAHLCDACGKSYKYRQGLRAHVKAVHEKQFQCRICKKTMCDQRDIDSHMNGHTQSKPYSCGTCKKAFQSKLSLTQHPCSSKLSSFKCDVCNKSFCTSKALKQHKIMHEPMPQFACQYCGLEFRHRQSRDRHAKKSCRVASGPAKTQK